MSNKKLITRTKIKQHIKIHGNEWTEITPTFVTYWWHLSNYAIFDSKLTLPKKIHCRNFRDGSYGWCLPLFDYTIELGIRRELNDRRTFLIVLIHEMVHQYDWEINKTKAPTHGKTFYSWAPLIKQIVNLPLNKYIYIE